MFTLTPYIQQPSQLTAEAVTNLSALVERYPYYQPARLVMLMGLHQLKDPRFSEELRKAAIHLPDRSVLFHLLEEPRMRPRPAAAPPQTKPSSEGADRTQSLIDSFLSQQPDMAASQRPHPVEPSVDYMSYLMQQPDALQEHLYEDLSEDNNPDDDGLFADEEPAAPAPSPSYAQTAVHDPYFTETLAHIYIKQGKYTKAIEIIRRLSLNVPEKNRYFADQIRFLEKLIVNERASE